MKQKNGLQNLPEQDRALILELCQEHTYQDVVHRLAQPRPDGLALKTSTSALSRFYTQFHPALYALTVDRQILSTLAQTPDHDLMKATLILVQMRIFRSLNNGSSLEQNLPALRFMLKFRRSFSEQQAPSQPTEDERAACAAALEALDDDLLSDPEDSSKEPHPSHSDEDPIQDHPNSTEEKFDPKTPATPLHRAPPNQPSLTGHHSLPTPSEPSFMDNPLSPPANVTSASSASSANSANSANSALKFPFSPARKSSTPKKKANSTPHSTNSTKTPGNPAFPTNSTYPAHS